MSNLLEISISADKEIIRSTFASLYMIVLLQ